MLKAPRCRCDSKSEDATLQQHYRKLDGHLHICTVHLHRAIDMQFIREAYRSFVFFFNFRFISIQADHVRTSMLSRSVSR